MSEHLNAIKGKSRKKVVNYYFIQIVHLPIKNLENEIRQDILKITFTVTKHFGTLCLRDFSAEKWSIIVALQNLIFRIHNY